MKGPKDKYMELWTHETEEGQMIQTIGYKKYYGFMNVGAHCSAYLIMIRVFPNPNS